MSHFTVMVRVPAETSKEKLQDHVSAILDPYCEHDDSGRLARFQDEFVDVEDEYRQKYEEESSEMVRCDDGSLVSVYDDRFREGVSDQLTRMNVPHKERFSSFERFVTEYADVEHDPIKGRYGYWRNPRAKWDWWCIGGRWRGHLFIKPNVEAGLGEKVDWCRIHDLDMERISKKTGERAENFWAQVDMFLSGKQFNILECPREELLQLGMLECKDAAELTGNEFWKSKRADVDRYDVIMKKPNREQLNAKVIAYFNTIRTWAMIDANGWHEVGEMGWWGSNNATPESTGAFVDQFNKWLSSGNQSDWIVVVDCHI